MRRTLRLMSEDARREKLLRAYDLERQDERVFWSTTSTLMLTALAAVVTLTIIAQPRTWGVWVAAPFISQFIAAYYVYQAAIGARRRWYMEALERELSTNEASLTVDKNDIPVRLFAYNRYSWSLNTFEGRYAAGPWAIVLFGMINTIIGLLLGSVIVVALANLRADHPLAFALTLTGTIFMLTLLTIADIVLLGEASRNATWTKGDMTFSGSQGVDESGAVPGNL
jgi:hypothetical protein